MFPGCYNEVASDHQLGIALSSLSACWVLTSSLAGDGGSRFLGKFLLDWVSV
jgi:hypothetical protein